MRRREYISEDISRVIDFVKLQSKYSVTEISTKTGISATTIWKISRNLVYWRNIRVDTAITLFECLYDDMIEWEIDTGRKYPLP